MKCKHIFQSLVFLLFTGDAISQDIPPATKAEERLESYQKRAKEEKNIMSNLEISNIGPTIMGGRITDLEVSPEDPNIFYIAYASGGLFYTENNGQSYTSLFDHEMVMTIGDIAVDWKNDIIWIGSGENNSSRSSYAGLGMFRSTDKGKSWEHKGLIESHHIGRVILHPEDPKILWVAVLGHLYSPNEDRGIYKSTDGGESWNKVLFIDENTGGIDLVIHPDNPDQLFAAMWHRERRAWNFVEGGKQSGIYQSDDGGENWDNISGDGSGFAIGDGIGRIGLDITGDGKKIFAVLDNQNERPEEEEKKKEAVTKDDLREMSKEKFLDLNNDDLTKYLRKYSFPKELTADSLKNLVEAGEILPHHLVDYVEDANRDLFDTEVVGAEVFVYDLAGEYWVRTHDEYIDDLVYTYGYYFGQIRVSKTNPDKVYITGVPLLKSDDGGKTFKSINGDNQHVDHHALWVSPYKEGHLINGNDGGLNISYDDGENWLKVKSPPVGQFYTVSVDNAKPYNVYGGLQDNGVWVGPSTYKEGSRWEGVGKYPYKRILGGDGFKVAIDSRDNKTVYTGYQFGHYFRFNREGGKHHKVTPRHELGERPLRFNWQSPIWLSKHNEDVFYFGSNKFHRSLNQGNDYDLSSRDLTKGGKKGNVSFGTLTIIHESPLQFGLIYLGTDDGLIYRSDDLGYNWENISAGLPQNMWVTRIQASGHDTNRVYATLNGYRWDHFDAYAYVSEDRGKTWQRIGKNLPLEPLNVIQEDTENENVLYVGSDHGLYISLDRGANFYHIKAMPSVAVHDLTIQKREKDLLIGTHGRSIYKLQLSELQKMNENILAEGIHLFKLSSVKYNDYWGKKFSNWGEEYEANLKIPVYVKKEGIYITQIQYESGFVVYSRADTLDAGMNYLEYDLSFNESALKKYKSLLDEKDREIEKAENGKYYLKPGIYNLVISTKTKMYADKREFKVEAKKRK